ncbi:hypothetical protein DSN97_05580 [Deferribacteraceae bacterium V6Fe1]|nr:hypothetical protein DSN97_05580 [Deferribacteraceae bacterium V6Fe1]
MNLYTDKKDVTFLESEFLTYLLGKYYLGDNVFETQNGSFYFEASKHIVLYDPNSEEKISIESDDFNSCKEIYTALKDGKKVFELSIKVKMESVSFDITFRTDPLRIVRVNAPKSIAEELQDKVVERALYLKEIYEIYDVLLSDFAQNRTTDDWYIFIRKFREFITNS